MRKFLLNLLGGVEKPLFVKPDEFTANTMARSVEDIKLSVTNTWDGNQIVISAWNSDIAFNLYRQTVDYLAGVTRPEKKQVGVE